METKFTKGEWNIRRNKIFIGDTYKSIATIHVIKNYKDITFEPIEDVESKANATIIVASKDLLIACEKVSPLIDKLINRTPSGKKRNELCDMNILVKTAINKATNP